jgi:hypothetical protein
MEKEMKLKTLKTMKDWFLLAEALVNQGPQGLVCDGYRVAICCTVVVRTWKHSIQPLVEGVDLSANCMPILTTKTHPNEGILSKFYKRYEKYTYDKDYRDYIEKFYTKDQRTVGYNGKKYWYDGFSNWKSMMKQYNKNFEVIEWVGGAKNMAGLQTGRPGLPRPGLALNPGEEI